MPEWEFDERLLQKDGRGVYPRLFYLSVSLIREARKRHVFGIPY